MAIYLCGFCQGDKLPADLGGYTLYHRNTEAQAMELYNKWKKTPKDQILAFYVASVELDFNGGESVVKVIRHTVNPIPKKVIYNKVEGKEPAKKKPQTVIMGWGDVPNNGDVVLAQNPVNWEAAHQAFQNMA